MTKVGVLTGDKWIREDGETEVVIEEDQDGDPESSSTTTYTSSVLSTYVEWDLAEYCTAKREGLVPDIYQGVPRSVNSCRVDSRSADSRASSLGPSDSASQQTGTDVIPGKSLRNILDGMEVPYERPEFLPITMLWDFEDCITDKTQGDIITNVTVCPATDPPTPRWKTPNTAVKRSRAELAEEEAAVARLVAENVAQDPYRAKSPTTYYRPLSAQEPQKYWE
ncbi:hypothetical protein EDB89DRAFT_2083117 [Lactarius sanguifluus]|nr:hypothetical protein EDB89DRAFT_2083117 [Lactarius sanguifluus]